MHLYTKTYMHLQALQLGLFTNHSAQHIPRKLQHGRMRYMHVM